MHMLSERRRPEKVNLVVIHWIMQEETNREGGGQLIFEGDVILWILWLLVIYIFLKDCLSIYYGFRTIFE